jgi:hypothetical protein
MSNKVYRVDVGFRDSLEKIRHAITWFNLTNNLKKGKETLRPRLVEILAYYVMRGYSTETKNFIIKSIPKMKKTNLNQINSELQKLGYLIQDRVRENDRHLHPSLEQLKIYIKDNEFPILVMTLKNNRE